VHKINLEHSRVTVTLPDRLHSYHPWTELNLPPGGRVFSWRNSTRWTPSTVSHGCPYKPEWDPRTDRQESVHECSDLDAGVWIYWIAHGNLFAWSLFISGGVGLWLAASHVLWAEFDEWCPRPGRPGWFDHKHYTDIWLNANWFIENSMKQTQTKYEINIIFFILNNQSSIWRENYLIYTIIITVSIHKWIEFHIKSSQVKKFLLFYLFGNYSCVGCQWWNFRVLSTKQPEFALS
jgi:hypothetical protein